MQQELVSILPFGRSAHFFRLVAVPEVKNELFEKVIRLDLHSTTFTNNTVSLSFSLSVSLSFCLSFPLSPCRSVACSYVVAHSQISHTYNTVDSVYVRGQTQEPAGMQSIHLPLFLCQCVCVRVICTLSFKFLRGLHAYIRC